MQADNGEMPDAFMSHLRSHRVLTGDEVISLAKRIETGDRDAWQELVCCNLRLVIASARKYSGHGVPMADLIQEGCLGLMHAVDKFDHRLGHRFSTYAVRWIRRYMQLAIQRQGAMVRLPEAVANRVAGLARVTATLTQELGRSPELDEIAVEADMTAAEVRALDKLRAPVASLDSMLANTDRMSLEGMSRDECADPADEVLRAVYHEQVLRTLRSLDERELTIISLHYGLDTGRALSLNEIGRLVGRSGEWVRQLERQALEKVRNAEAGALAHGSAEVALPPRARKLGLGFD